VPKIAQLASQFGRTGAPSSAGSAAPRAKAPPATTKADPPKRARAKPQANTAQQRKRARASFTPPASSRLPSEDHDAEHVDDGLVSARTGGSPHVPSRVEEDGEACEGDASNSGSGSGDSTEQASAALDERRTGKEEEACDEDGDGSNGGTAEKVSAVAVTRVTIEMLEAEKASLNATPAAALVGRAVVTDCDRRDAATDKSMSTSASASGGNISANATAAAAAAAAAPAPSDTTAAGAAAPVIPATVGESSAVGDGSDGSDSDDSDDDYEAARRRNIEANK
jgi:hypothetical protein